MLDKQKVMQELIQSVPTLFKETTNERALAHAIFSWLQNNPSEAEKLQALQSSFAIPTWQGAFDAIMPIEPHEHPYAVVAVDGSQIYPDRHQGLSCYLLNSGVAHFMYGEKSSARLFSTPSLITQNDYTDMSEDMVNCRRAELEFGVGLQETLKAQEQHPEVPSLFLCDGSLIFWHLESKHPRIKERFLKRYIEQLDAFYQKQVLIAGCISMPKSKELVSVLKRAVTHNFVKIDTPVALDTLIDTDITDFFLRTGQTTTLFIHNSTLANNYPEHLRPCFVYMHVGDEVLRIELPFWIGHNAELLTRTCRIIRDQCSKGNGYPIALAEAHEQAVVSSQDRQFFFEMLYKMAIDQNYRLHSSQKSLKKRFVSI